MLADAPTGGFFERKMRDGTTSKVPLCTLSNMSAPRNPDAGEHTMVFALFHGAWRSGADIRLSDVSFDGGVMAVKAVETMSETSGGEGDGTPRVLVLVDAPVAAKTERVVFSTVVSETYKASPTEGTIASR